MTSIIQHNLTQVEINLIKEKTCQMIAIPLFSASNFEIIEHRNIAYIFIIQNFKISVCRLRIYKYRYKFQNDLENFKITHKIQFNVEQLQSLQDIIFFSQAKAKEQIVKWKDNIFKIMKQEAIIDQNYNNLKTHQKQFLKFIQVFKNQLQNLLEVKKILVDHIVFINSRHQYELRLLVDFTSTKSLIFYFVQCSQNNDEERKIRFKILNSHQQRNFTLKQMQKQPIMNFNQLRKQIQMLIDSYKIIQILNKPEYNQCSSQISKCDNLFVEAIGFWKIDKVYKFQFKIFLEDKKICFSYEYESRFVENKGIYENKLLVIQNNMSFDTAAQFESTFKPIYKFILENWEICNDIFPKIIAVFSKYHFDFETITTSQFDTNVYDLGMLVIYDFPLPIFIKFTYNSVKKLIKCISPVGQIQNSKQFFITNLMFQFEKFATRMNNVAFSVLRNCTLMYYNAKSTDQEWIIKKLNQFDILYARSRYNNNFNIGIYIGHKKILNFKYNQKNLRFIGKCLFKNVIIQETDIYRFISKCQIRILRWRQSIITRDQILLRIRNAEKDQSMKSFGITKNLQQKIFQIVCNMKLSPQMDIVQQIISSKKKQVQYAQNILRHLKDLRSQDDDSVLISGIDFIGVKIAKDLKNLLSSLNFHQDQLNQYFWCFNRKELV